MKSWILFNSHDIGIDGETSKKHFCESIDSMQAREDGEYCQAYALKHNHMQSRSEDSSFINMKSCYCDSKQSNFKDDYKTSLMINQIECDHCKNLILRQENRRCSMCGDCVEKLYSPKTCTSCNGRISFQDLKNSVVQQNANKRHFNEFVDPVKLCNCFPKYPSQQFSSIQPNSSNEIQVLPKIVGKACSCSMIMMQQKRKTSPSFHSHHSLSANQSSSDESSEDEQ